MLFTFDLWCSWLHCKFRFLSFPPHSKRLRFRLLVSFFWSSAFLFFKLRICTLCLTSSKFPRIVCLKTLSLFEAYQRDGRCKETCELILPYFSTSRYLFVLYYLYACVVLWGQGCVKMQCHLANVPFDGSAGGQSVRLRPTTKQYTESEERGIFLPPWTYIITNEQNTSLPLCLSPPLLSAALLWIPASLQSPADACRSTGEKDYHS